MISKEDLEAIWNGTLTPLSDEERTSLVFPERRNDNLRAHTFWFKSNAGVDEKCLVILQQCERCKVLRRPCDRGLPSCSLCTDSNRQCVRDTSQPEVISVENTPDGSMLRFVRFQKKTAYEAVQPQPVRMSGECCFRPPEMLFTTFRSSFDE